ncbi:MAG: PD-(D/E)XK motif protein [Chloroflexi bacterium]|nr:PD-(D/E)XK motif protein [Chloroflexota bacterium]
MWRYLEEDTRVASVPGRVQRRVLPDGRRNLFLGLEIPSRSRMLILRVSAQAVEGLPDVPDSRGLIVRVEPRETGSNEAEVVLALVDSEHRDIFDLLIWDLIAAAEQPEDESEGLRRFLARLSNWQHLLRRLGPRGLTREGQQGLWGELWVLREVVAPVAGIFRALDGWRGPMGTDQDFQMGSTCIEVKTSMAAHLDRVAISSERQLEVPEDVLLLLLALSLDGRANHGETLPEMIESVRVTASGAGCLHLLDLRLDLLGYSNGDAHLYEDMGYTIRSLHPFRVEAGFPRIVPDDLQTGIGDVRYSVSTASCSAFRMDLQQPGKLLKGLV